MAVRKIPETVFGNLCRCDGTKIIDAYRYQLYRGEPCLPFDEKEKSDRTLCFIMLNPSTADATVDDPTIKRCRNYAVRWEYQHLFVVNLFAYRTPFPLSLSKAYSEGVDVVGPENDDYISSVAERSDMIIAAWGAPPRKLEWRATAVREKLREELRNRRVVHALGLTKAGHPRHPLYVKKDIAPFLFFGV